LVPSQRVPYKSNMLVANELKKSVGLKPWKMALTWFPSPVKVAGVMPPIEDTVLALFDCGTACTVVQRASLVTDPSAIKVVTWSITNIVLFCQYYKTRMNSIKT